MFSRLTHVSKTQDCHLAYDNHSQHHREMQRLSEHQLPRIYSIVDRASRDIHEFYYRYSVTFGLYVLTPMERLITNSIVMLLFSLLIYTIYVYLPSFAARSAERVLWYLTGDTSIHERLFAATANELVTRATDVLNMESLIKYSWRGGRGSEEVIANSTAKMVAATS